MSPYPGLKSPLERPRPRYSGWSSLATRILFVNLLALLVLGGGLFYLENFRARLLETRVQELMAQGETMAQFLRRLPPEAGRAAVAEYRTPRGTRAQLYAADGRQVADNWDDPANPRFHLEDPTTAGFRRQSAILLDRVTDFLTGERDQPPFPDTDPEDRSGWPEAEQAAISGQPITATRMTEDRLVVLQAAVPLGNAAPHPVLLLTVDTPDVIDLVRRERQGSFNVFLGVLAFSLGLSAYLARVIVVPLRQLALAAHRVRLGRARDVVVPRLPHRRDEIGGLARALADMTATLRHRIDATEAFAADVAHELKNPLASLRSAVEALGRVRNDDARQQLFALIDDDVRRIDRLISDISAASRIDAELSRTRMQPLDLGALAEAIVRARMASGPLARGVQLVADVPTAGRARVLADADRLGQVVNNLLDNAISFSSDGGTVRIAVDVLPRAVRLTVEDDGPGVPPEARDAIFQRFYTERTEAEHYGAHSGLGLSITRAIVEALDGAISVTDRPDGHSGARFIVSLPLL